MYYIYMKKTPINNLLEMYCYEIQKHIEDKNFNKEKFCEKYNISEQQYKNILVSNITALSINVLKNIIKQIRGIK